MDYFARILIGILLFSPFPSLCAHEDPHLDACNYEILADEIQKQETSEENEDVIADRDRNEYRDRDQRNLYETNRDNLRREAREKARKNRYNTSENNPETQNNYYYPQ